MILGENIGSVYSKGKEIQRVFSKGKLVWEKAPSDYSIIPFTVEAVSNIVEIEINKGYSQVDFKYSINNGEWIYTNSQTILTINRNDKVSIIGTRFRRCAIDGLSDVYGNIMSLLYGDDFIGQTVLPSILLNFFNKSGASPYNSDIRHAENLVLPATTLKKQCYEGMFRNCIWLITAPKQLPATTLAEHCYCDMFKHCDSLTTVPELPATALARGCYSNMFYGCEKITTAPELPATALAEYCYHMMFVGCSSLTTAPELPATLLKDGCYLHMFSTCESINYIKCYATMVKFGYNIKDCIEGWLDSNSPTGTFECYESFADKLTPYIPSTWTVEYLT